MVNARLRKSGPWLRILLATALGVTLGSGVLVETRTQITSLRYRLTQLMERESHLLGSVEKLRIEAAALSAPRRIETRARALGLHYPDAGRVIRLPSPVAAGPPE